MTWFAAASLLITAFTLFLREHHLYERRGTEATLLVYAAWGCLIGAAWLAFAGMAP